MQYYVLMQIFGFQLTFYWKWPILTPPFDPRELENGIRLGHHFEYKAILKKNQYFYQKLPRN